MKVLVSLAALLLLLAGCGDDDDDTIETPPAGLPVAIGGLMDGEVSGEVDVLGFVVVDHEGTRFCSVLMESFPPQCGAPSVDLEGLDPAALELQSEGETRWSDGVVVLRGSYDDGVLTVGEILD